jgi:acyl-CoA dehydrogenase
MDYDWTPTQKERLEAIKTLLDDAGKAELAELDGADRERARSLTLAWQAKLGEQGYLDPGLGDEGPTRLLDLLAAQEELAKASGSLFISIEVTARLFAGLVLGHAAAELEEDADLKAGGVIAGLPLIKGDDKVTATAGPDGTWSLEGEMSQMVNAPIADWLMIPAESEGGRLLVLVRSGDAGVEIAPRLEALGFDGLQIAPVALRGAVVPAMCVLGPFTDFRPLMRIRVLESQALALAAVGIMQRCVVHAKAYARTHKRGEKPLVKHQEVSFKLAEMLTLTQTAQLMTDRAIWLCATGDPEGLTVLECAKIFAAESAEEVASLGLDVEGGDGLRRGGVLERSWREARFVPAAGVISDEGRDAIARALLARHQP